MPKKLDQVADNFRRGSQCKVCEHFKIKEIYFLLIDSLLKSTCVNFLVAF